MAIWCLGSAPQEIQPLGSMLSFLGFGPAATSVFEPLEPEQELRSIEHASLALDDVLGDDFEAARAKFEDPEYADVNHVTGAAVVTFLLGMLSMEPSDTDAAKVKVAEALAAREAALSQAKKVEHDKTVLGPETAHQLQISTLLQLQGLLGFASASIPEAIKAAWRFKRSYGMVNSLERELKEKGLLTAKSKLTDDYPKLPLLDRMTITGIMFSHGLISLILSIIPPSIGRILAVIGFKGKKTDALAEIHAAAEHDDNPYNTMCVLALAIYYHGSQGLCEIAPQADVDGFARLFPRIESLAQRYPKSPTWQLQLSHIVQRKRGLKACTAFVEKIDTTGRLAQTRASQMWELAINYLAMLDFQSAAKTLIELETLNNWNKTLYNYLIGACHAQLYLERGDEADAAVAEERFDRAPKTIGEKKLLGKTIPIEALIQRKLHKLKRRAADAGKTRYVDGISTSPILDNIHLFLGWQRQDQEQLARSYELASRPGVVEDSVDDAILRKMMLATIERLRGQTEEAKRLLDGVEGWNSSTMSGVPDAETWAVPSAFEEMAALAWAKKDLDAFQMWLDKVDRFPEHEMSAREGIRLSMARQALDEARSA